MSEYFQNKKLLIVYQPWRKQEVGLAYPIKLSMESFGMQADILNTSAPPPFQNKNLPDKLINVFRRLALKDTTYYLKAEKMHYHRFYMQKLKQHAEKNYDFILVIRPDEYKPDFFKQLRNYGKIMSGYIWDGIHKEWAEDLKKSAKYFKTIACFDHNDINKHPQLPLHFATNFYFDNLISKSNRNVEYIFSYIGGIGSKDSSRRDKVILDNFEEYLLRSEVIIQYDEGYIEPADELQGKSIQYRNDYMPYLEVLEREQNAKAIIDICKPHHKGLSFRAFESLYFEKKLITNNTEIVNYDFYRPENILVLDYKNPEINKHLIAKFLEVPYKKIDSEIINQYSLTNWFIKLFDIPN